METAGPQLPWWAHGGSERCPRCLQLYAYEVEFRCVDCDGPLCPFCVVTAKVEVSSVAVADARCGECVDCRDEEGA